MPNRLMFEVGVKEVDKKISELRKEFDSFEAKYGQQGIQVKLNLQGAIGDVQALIDALKNVGDTSKLKQYEEEIAKLKKQIDALQATASGTGSSTAAGVDKTAKSVNTASDKIEYLLNLLKDVKYQSVKFGDANYDVTRLDNILNKLTRIKQELDLIKDNGGLHPITGQTANQMLSEANVSGIERNLKMELSYYKQIETELEKIQNIKNSLQGILGGTTDLIKHNEIRKTITDLENMEGMLSRRGSAEARFLIKDSAYQETLSNAKNLINTEQDLRRVDETVLNINSRLEKYNSLINDAQKAKIDTTSFETQKREVERLYELLQQIQSNRGLTNDFRTFAQVMQQYGIEISKTDKEAKNLQKTFSQKTKGFTGDPYKDVVSEITRVLSLLKELKSTEQKETALKINDVPLKNAINELEQYLSLLERIKAAGGQLPNGLTVYGLRGDKFDIAKEANARGQFAVQNANAANSVHNLTEEEQKLAQALGHSSSEMKNQSAILSDLKMMAYQYLSVWGAQSFLNNIIEIGGQLEKQRLSIGAILQDSAHGADLFDKIKRLAVQSPFGVIELDQFTKQLSAYGFKYNELYDMTKRLADISAGAGTEVSRLALALGHVRAESALSGYTLRQFAMNNIPMVSELAKKLSEVEGHLVTTADVRKRVSNKEISYQDVEDVIKKLTDQGGMFYRMQEVISESVQAKFKNLRDSFDIMFGDIAKSSIGDFLKEVATVLTKMSRNWQDFIPILKAAGIAFLGYRTSLLAVNMAMGKNTVAVTKSILAYKAKRATELEQIALTRKLTQQEMALINSKNKLTAADVRVMMTTKALTRDEALRLVTLKKLSAEEVQQLINLKLFTQAEIAAAQASSVLAARIGLIGAAMRKSIASFGSMIFNKWNALFAALGVAMHLYQKQDQYNEERKARMEDLWQRSREGQRNLGEMVATYHVGLSAEVDEDGLKQAISDLKEKLKDYAPDVNSIFNEAFKVGIDAIGHGNKAYEQNVHTLAEQYEILAKALEDTEKAYKKLIDVRWLVDDAIESTQDKFSILGKWELNSFFDDNITENIKNFAEASKEADAAMLKFNRDYHDAMNAALKAAGKVFNEDDIEGMEKAVRSLEKHSTEYIKFARSLREESDKVESGTSYGAWGTFIEKYDEQKKQWAELEKDVTTMGERLFKNLTLKWGRDIDAWTTEQQLAVRMIFDDIIGKEMEAAGVSEETQKKIREMFMKPFGIKFQAETEAAYKEIDELKSYLESITNKAWIVKLKVEGSDSVDIIDKARKERKAAKEGLEELTKDIERKGMGSFIENVIKRGDTSMDMATTPAERRMLKDWLVKRQNKRLAEQTLDEFGAEYEVKKDKKSGGRGEDKEAKKLREIAKLYKDAYDWYKKYAQQIGESAGLNKVESQFQPLFDEFNKEWNTNLTLDSIPKYRENLERLIETAQKMYKTKEHRNNYMVDAIKTIRDAISDVDYTEAQRKMDEYASRVQTDLDNLTRAWELFNNVREATGNVELAEQLSGADYTNGRNRNLADALRKKIEEDFSSSNVVSIPFDMNLDDRDIEKKIMDAFNESAPLRENGETEKEYAARLTKYQEKIKGIIEAYKKWRDLQRDVLKDDVQIFAKIIGSSQDYATQLQKITNDYDKEKESLGNMLKLYNSGQVDEKGNRRGINIDQYMKALQQIDADKELKVLKLGDQYAMYMAGAFGVMRDNVVKTAQTIESKLNKAMKANVIDAKTYAEEMRKVRDMLDKYREESFFGKENPFVAFMNGGLKGANDYVKSAIQALESKKEPLTAEEQKQLKTLKDLQNSLSKTIGGLSSFAMVLSIAQGVVDGFASAAQTLSDMFDALGQEGAANLWSDVSDSIKAGSSFLQPVNNILQNALSGNIGGVLSSAISAPVDLIAGPIIGFAQLNDKKHERRIQDLKKEITKIDNTLNTIRSLRERELGYDKGNLRRQLLEQYKSQEVTGSLFGNKISLTPTISAMAEYYGRFNGGNGYSQEYNALIETRKKYMEMYDEENSKKKKSQDALEEYKTNIAALDEEIMFFTQDLAKELWSIDIQGWAEQIGDALWTAFENGEDAVEAFGDTARDIISNVAKNMWQLSILKPLFNELQETLFGQYKDGKYTGGTIKYDRNGNIDMQASEQPTLEALGQFFGKNGVYQQAIEGGQQFYEWVQKITGIDLSKEDSSNATASIKSITEQTADLLASYVNAIRADVSVDRGMIADYFPQYLAAMTSGNASLQNIEQNTAAIMRSNDAIQKSVADLYSDIHGLRTTAWKMPIA